MPTNTSSATPARTSVPTATGPPTLTPTASSPATNDLRIVDLSYSGRDEFISVRNNGLSSQSMAGWKIISVVGDQTYSFPAGYTLGVGVTVRVHSGPDAFGNPPTDLLWTTGYIWNNSGDKAELRNSSGVVVNSQCYGAGCP